MTPRIDLSKAPSAMEALAASWAKPTGEATANYRPAYQPQVYAKPDTASIEPPAPKRRPKLFPKPPMSKSQKKMVAEIARQLEAELRSYIAPPEPDPASYAYALPFHIAEALIGATRCTNQEWAGHSEVPDNHLLHELRARGLVYYNNRCLSFFARDVRKVLMVERG